MKLGDMIKRVDRSEANYTEAYLYDFCEVLDIQDYVGKYDEFSNRVKGYYLSKWLCTDTWIGTIVYYMDDIPVAVSAQYARKNEKDIYFVSKETAAKVKEFILTLVESPEVPLCDLEEEFEDTYIVEFPEQLLTDSGFVAEKLCKVVSDRPKNPYGMRNTIKVQFEDESTEEVDVRNFRIPYHISITN